jgi:hypothetical protein
MTYTWRDVLRLCWHLIRFHEITKVTRYAPSFSNSGDLFYFSLDCSCKANVFRWEKQP